MAHKKGGQPFQAFRPPSRQFAALRKIALAERYLNRESVEAIGRLHWAL